MATYSGSDKRLKYLFQNGGGGGGASALVDLTDVNISSPTDGQVLIYDANNDVWVNSSAGSPTSLASLSDVTLTSPTTGQVLTYNGSDWVNATGGGGSGHTYSTTEQVVGTWIDGKPIYEKTLSWYNTKIEAASYAHGIVDLEKCVNTEAFLVDSTNNQTYLFPFHGNDGVLLIRGVNQTDVILSGTNYFNPTTGRTFYVTLRYTKTTD